MAESSSTGNSGTTGTTSTSTSTSNGGPASSGSQTSSNGSFSTGNGNGGSNGGKGPGLSFGAGVGAVNGPSIGLPSFNSGKSGFTGFATSNFGQGWGGPATHTVAPGADGKHTIHPDANGKHTVYATTESDRSGSTVKQLTVPFMTVDDVYGKGNQSMVENQGDYGASSNEKSNVETSTFGKQDEISVTPLSVTKDEGLVNNDAIQSVEGLDFQQKDKASQEVMEAEKSNELPAGVEVVSLEEAEIAQLENEQENNASRLDEISNEADQLKESLDKEDADYQAKLANNKQLDAIGRQMQEFTDEYQEVASRKDNIFTSMGIQRDLSVLDSKVARFCEQLGVEPPRGAKNEINAGRAYETFQSWEEGFIQENFEGLKDFSPNSIAAYKAGIDEAHLQRTQEISESLDAMVAEAKALENRQKELPGLIADAKKKSEEAAAAKAKAEEEAAVTDEEAAAKAKAEETVTTETPSYKTAIETAKNEINNSKDLTDEQKAEADTVLGNVESAADDMNKASNNLAKNLNDIDAIQQYEKATARYNKALEDAKGNKVLKNTDRNKTFTKAVAAANDFMVTREDGTQQSYAEFAAEMATKSPELAKGLYEAKAKNYEENGHKILAKIERAKSKMVMTWLGSKFTFADNHVRNQFNQMAKTDMRATYATYNNVLSDETGEYSEADKAEASAAINQANSLMTAAAALQASTGFFSGIGDSMSDGEYGKTDPGKLNAYQETLNAVGNFAKFTLGLGVTPGANEAYQNMYYLAGAKVNESGLFTTDFDGDGFALCQEYGNNAAAGMIAGAGELATGIALMFNPATSQLGLKLAIDSVQTFLDGLYGVQKEVNKSIKYSSEVLNYFNEAKNIAAETGNKEATSTIGSAIKQIEDFQLKSDEVGNLDNWLEGSGSNTADNGKFNQALSYDEWLKLIEADPVMQEYAKSLNR